MCAKYGEPERIQKPTPSLKKRNLRTQKSSSQRRTGLEEAPRGVSPGFGEKIRSVRESKGWTREQLAKKLQVKESYLAKLELEKIHPNDKMAKKIERLLEIKLISQLEPGDVVSSKKAISKMTLGDIVRVLDEKSK
jgi:putative transcription factor